MVFNSTTTLSRRCIVINQRRISLLEAGPPTGPGLLCLHGWPQSAEAFTAILTRLASRYRVVALDLPGVGESADPPPRADKRTLAGIVHEVIDEFRLTDITLVGHDIGGQIAYACLRTFPHDIRRVAILNVAVPGIEPWDEVIHNPRIWHFGFHAVPDLPELLVGGHRAEYFDFFFQAIAGSPEAISKAARARYCAAYARADALRTAFDWYRTFEQDASDNTSGQDQPVDTPVLYVRGGMEAGLPLERYVSGLRAAGIKNVVGQTIPDAGHFTLDEQPDRLSAVLEQFAAGQTAEIC